MRRLLALAVAVGLLIPFTGLTQAANGGSGDTSAGPRGFGHFLFGDENGAIGSVSFDVRQPTVSDPMPGRFQIDFLPNAGGAGWPIMTRSVVASVNFRHESGCCGYPDIVDVRGFDCFYFPTPESACRPFLAQFFDVGRGTGGDFFRYGEDNDSPPPGWEPPEYWVGEGTLTVNLGT